MDGVDDVGIVADVVLDAGQRFRLLQQPLHLLLGAAKAQLQVIQHGVVLLGKALISVLDTLDVAAHLVGVVRHVRDGHIRHLHGLPGVAAQTADQRRGKARGRLHIGIGAQARRLVGIVCVVHQCLGVALEQRLHAADQLLIVGIAVHDFYGRGSGGGKPGLRRAGNARRSVSHLLRPAGHLVRSRTDFLKSGVGLVGGPCQIIQRVFRLDDLSPEALKLVAVFVNARVLQLLLGVLQLLQLILGGAHSLGQQLLLLFQQLRVARIHLQQLFHVF